MNDPVEPSSPGDVFSATPMKTNFKLSTDKIDTSETNTRDYSKQSLLERRDSFRLSFHRQGSISSALGTLFFSLWQQYCFKQFLKEGYKIRKVLG